VPLPKLDCFRLQFSIRKSLGGLLQIIDFMDSFAHFLDQPVIPAAHHFCYQLIEHLRGFFVNLRRLVFGVNRPPLQDLGA
jgi:hypothetical protein